MIRCSRLAVLLVCIILSGCAVNLPFNNRLDYFHVYEARRLATNKKEPISIEWLPSDFTKRVEVKGASGFVGFETQIRIPTGVALSSRITEALDEAIGVDNRSKSLLEIYVLSAESKFKYSAGIFSTTSGMDYGWCNLEVEFNYNGTKWKDTFVSEEKDETIGATSQTAVLEKVWDNIALQVAKRVAAKVEQLPKNDTYKDSEQYRLMKSEREIREQQEKVKAAEQAKAKAKAKKDAATKQWKGI